MGVKPKPDGYHSITPYLVVNGAVKAIDFYKEVLGAKEVMRLTQPDGRIGHAELRIGDSTIMLADEFPEMDIRGPKSYGGTAVNLLVYVDDVDAVYDKAVEAGAEPHRPVHDQFYGDRSGVVIDPFGHSWSIATHIEDVSPEEIAKRAKECSDQPGS